MGTCCVAQLRHDEDSVPALPEIRMRSLQGCRPLRRKPRRAFWATFVALGIVSFAACGAQRPVLAPVDPKLRATTTVAPPITPTSSSKAATSATAAKLDPEATAKPKGTTKPGGKATTTTTARLGAVHGALPPMENTMRGLIATPVGNPEVHKSPSVASALIPVARVNALGVTTVFAVVGDDNAPWIEVLLPTRPNGSTGWVQRSQVSVATTDARIFISLERRVLKVLRGTSTLLQATVAIGTVTNPTPRGPTYVSELIDTGKPNGAYGPYAFGLAMHSNTLTEFAGGDGQVGVHGTNAPKLIGQRVSHGCVRMTNENVRRLVDLKLALGTPVYIS